MLRSFGHRSARAVTSFLLEGGLVFLVLYVLSMLTSALSKNPSAATGAAGSDFSAVVTLGSLIFAGTLVTTSPRRLHGTIDARRQLLITSLVCFGVGILAFVACCAWTDAPWFANAGVMLGGAVAVPLVVSAWRWSAIHLRVFEGNRERVLVLGTGETARGVSRWISERCPNDFEVVGFAARTRDEIGKMVASGTRVIASFQDMTATMSPHIDRIIVALEEKRGILPTHALMHLRLSGVVIEDATTFLERTSGKIAVENLLPSWLIFSDGFRVSRTRMFCKRLSDIGLSVALLIVASPAMLLTAIAIRLESGGRGPVLFRQDRVGRHGREFEMIKFRSMVADAEHKSGPAWAASNDPRVTRVGRFIRKTRIDELPQLLNVLRGEMSFVGPRPERHHFVEQLQEEIPYFSLRLAVRPGITGWAQVSYGYGSNVEENREKLKYDLFYIKNVSFFLDLWVVLKTVGVVLRGSGAR